MNSSLNKIKILPITNYGQHSVKIPVYEYIPTILKYLMASQNRYEYETGTEFNKIETIRIVENSIRFEIESLWSDIVKTQFPH